MDKMERLREPVRELTRDERTFLVFALRYAAPRDTPMRSTSRVTWRVRICGSSRTRNLKRSCAT